MRRDGLGIEGDLLMLRADEAARTQRVRHWLRRASRLLGLATHAPWVKRWANHLEVVPKSGAVSGGIPGGEPTGWAEAQLGSLTFRINLRRCYGVLHIISHGSVQSSNFHVR